MLNLVLAIIASQILETEKGGNRISKKSKIIFFYFGVNNYSFDIRIHTTYTHLISKRIRLKFSRRVNQVFLAYLHSKDSFDPLKRSSKYLLCTHAYLLLQAGIPADTWKYLKNTRRVLTNKSPSPEEHSAPRPQVEVKGSPYVPFIVIAGTH